MTSKGSLYTRLAAQHPTRLIDIAAGAAAGSGGLVIVLTKCNRYVRGGLARFKAGRDRGVREQVLQGFQAVFVFTVGIVGDDCV